MNLLLILGCMLGDSFLDGAPEQLVPFGFRHPVAKGAARHACAFTAVNNPAKKGPTKRRSFQGHPCQIAVAGLDLRHRPRDAFLKRPQRITEILLRHRFQRMCHLRRQFFSPLFFEPLEHLVQYVRGFLGSTVSFLHPARRPKNRFCRQTPHS